MRICFCLVLALTGCRRNFFTAHGTVSAQGPAFGDWSSTPQGCSRDPIDRPLDRTVATFFWEDPALHNPMLRDHRMAHTPDAPEQVSLLRAPAGGYDVRIKTIETAGWLLRPQDCTHFAIETQEQGPGFPGGRSSLAGAVHFSCTAKQSQIQADFTFARCDY